MISEILVYFKVPENSLQTNETGRTKKMRIAKGQKLFNELLTDFTSLYGSREEWVGGWRGLGDWFVREYLV